MSINSNPKIEAQERASRMKSWRLRNRQLVVLAMIVAAMAAVAFSRIGQAEDGGDGRRAIQWVNHFDLLSGDPSVTFTTSNSTTSGVGGGLTGLVVTSNTLGNTDSFGGNKVVQMALELPDDTRITGVRLCYELSAGSTSYIDQIRLAQIQNPPSTALVLLDDATPQSAIGPVCVDSLHPATPIESRNGSVLLSFRFLTGNVSDQIVIRAVGLHVK